MFLLLFFSHDELLSQGGHYCDMWQQQLTKLEETDATNGNNENNGNIVVAAEVNGITQ